MSSSSPRPEQTAYDILSVARTASADDIKKRYRELARTSHPDVNPSNPNAAKIFAQITTAYKTLSDAQARATYDAEISLRERVAQQAAQRAGTRAQQTASMGSGRATPSPALQNPNSVEAQRLTSEAQAAFSRGKFIEARTKAEQALRLNRRNAAAYEILGDVYRLQGKADEAINMYTLALQLNQHNPALRARLERLARSNAAYTGPTAERVFFDNRDASERDRSGMRPPASAPRSPAPANLPFVMGEPKRSIVQLLVGLVGYGGVVFMLIYFFLNPGDPPRAAYLPFISTWNPVTITVLGLSGLLLGATMAITGTIRRIEDELLFTGGGRGSTPLGPFLIFIGAINFYAGVAVYGLLNLTQGTFTRSMQRVFASVALVTILLAAAYPLGAAQVLLWGGGVVFFAYIIGWVLGDVFRGD